ncbi:hypothetical protein [Amycolatopsis taiwanensis]|uniref:Uncharacterized protein n=1 Tax=Amycolatopsis taiwanensis TaxID=342230 RepID=A0A9W6R426_9PSEU|nr:hypothetical protein [Amycolatopsis taiwanensis]GLY69109.1 hypothetical protein Atai01_57280 [Amycolatopsis taiwanensis]
MSIYMLLSGLVASSLMLLGAGEAAAKSFQLIQSAVSTHTDVHAPLKNFPDSGDTPVGAWVDADGYHLSKSYFSVDPSALRGATILESVIS